MACNSFEANVNGVLTWISISCRNANDWYVSGPIIGKGKLRRCAILKDHLPSAEAAESALREIVKNGYNGPLE